MAVEFHPPEVLQGPAFTLINHSVNGPEPGSGVRHRPRRCAAADAAVRVVCSPFPATRGFMMLWRW
jgi:branched-chain amino acid transport system permease protein